MAKRRHTAKRRAGEQINGLTGPDPTAHRKAPKDGVTFLATLCWHTDASESGGLMSTVVRG